MPCGEELEGWRVSEHPARRRGVGGWWGCRVDFRHDLDNKNAENSSLDFSILVEITTLGSQHPSPNVKSFCNFEPQIWPEIITSRDAESTCFKGSRTSCDVIKFGLFWPNFGQKSSHHVMDASRRTF